MVARTDQSSLQDVLACVASIAACLLAAAAYVAVLVFHADIVAVATSTSFLCVLLAFSEIGLSVQAWRAAGRREAEPHAFFLPAGVAGLLAILHVHLAFLGLPHSDWSVAIVRCVSVCQVWSVPVWLAASAVVVL